MLDIYFVRHAESTNNVNAHIVGGRSNEIPITDKGKKQARLLGERWRKANYRMDKVFASVANRAQETARIVCQEINFDKNEIQSEEDIVELCQGDWTGKLRSEIYNEAMLQKIRQDPHHFKPPNGESQAEVETRMYNWLEVKVLPYFEQNLKIAIFSHGLAIKCLFRKITQANPHQTYRISIDNTSVCHFRYDERGWHLGRLNDHAHLEALHT